MGRRRHAGHVFAKVCAPNTKATWQIGSIPLVAGWKKPASDIMSLRVLLVGCLAVSFLPSFLPFLSPFLPLLFLVSHGGGLRLRDAPLGRKGTQGWSSGVSCVTSKSRNLLEEKGCFHPSFVFLSLQLHAFYMWASFRILWPKSGPTSISLFPLTRRLQNSRDLRLIEAKAECQDSWSGTVIPLTMQMYFGQGCFVIEVEGTGKSLVQLIVFGDW